LSVVHFVFVYFELQWNEKVQTSIGSSLQNLQKLFDWHFYAIALIMVMGAVVWKTTV
jgi:hypothetical protein